MNRFRPHGAIAGKKSEEEKARKAAARRAARDKLRLQLNPCADEVAAAVEDGSQAIGGIILAPHELQAQPGVITIHYDLPGAASAGCPGVSYWFGSHWSAGEQAGAVIQGEQEVAASFPRPNDVRVKRTSTKVPAGAKEVAIQYFFPPKGKDKGKDEEKDEGKKMAHSVGYGEMYGGIYMHAFIYILVYTSNICR